jgi:DNA-binding NarL/FixJ family response regulator
MPANILIADDSSVTRKTLRKLLETQDQWIVVGEAVDGNDALQKAEELQPDLVILDLAMPNMNGLEATRELKRRHPSLPLVMFTVFTDTDIAKIVLSAGASAVVSKSNAGQLVSHVHQLLEAA